MPNEYKTIYKGGNCEISEKKSRFIANTLPIQNEEEAIAFIELMKKKYWDAKHHCFAYVIGEHNEIQRCSDDGEPNGTAGRPILDVLVGEGIHNSIIVVTRYFGGTLLGTGGLVRAYSGAAKASLTESTIIIKKSGFILSVIIDYTGAGKIQYILGQRDLKILESAYTEQVNMKILVPQEEKESIISEITDGTNGRAVIEEVGSCFFAYINNEWKIFS